jgi:hypothetical protein
MSQPEHNTALEYYPFPPYQQLLQFLHRITQLRRLLSMAKELAVQ